MNVFNLTSSRYIKEGRYYFHVSFVSYEHELGQAKLLLQLHNGKKHTLMFFLKNKAGETNEFACNSFSFFIRKVMNDYKITSLNPLNLKNKYFYGEVKYNKGRGNHAGTEFMNVNVIEPVTKEKYLEERNNFVQQTGSSQIQNDVMKNEQVEGVEKVEEIPF